MSEESAILAQFSDWRTVKGRKVLQLIFEVPLEEQAKVLTHLGAPMPLADLWCGIARVAPGRGKAAGGKTAPGPDQPGVASPLEATPAVGNSKPKRRWQDMPASQRAALMVRHAAFPAFALTAWGVECGPDEALKAELGIASKSSLDPDDVGRQDGGLLQRFESIERQFEAFKIARGHGVI